MVMKMIAEKDTKINRILEIYTKLIKGEVVNKKEMAQIFNLKWPFKTHKIWYDRIRKSIKNEIRCYY